jgi:hypothetical protein
VNLALKQREKFVGARKTDDKGLNVVIVGGGAAGHTAVETFRYII